MKFKIKKNIEYTLGAVATILILLGDLTRLETFVVIGGPLFWASALLFLNKLLKQQDEAICKLKDEKRQSYCYLE